MGRRGPPPEPTAIRILKGNPGKRPIHENVRPAPNRPVCPAWLDREAKAEWRRIVPELDAMGVLTRVDRSALAAYCTTWSRWRDAEEKLQKFGPVLKPTASGYLPQSPFVALARTYLEEMTRLMREFGLTPASRSRLDILQGADDDDDDDEFLSGPRRSTG